MARKAEEKTPEKPSRGPGVRSSACGSIKSRGSDGAENRSLQGAA